MEYLLPILTISLGAGIGLVLKGIIKELKAMTVAFANLTKAIEDLTTAVNVAVDRITEPGTPDADVQAAADDVNAQTARLVAAVLPVP